MRFAVRDRFTDHYKCPNAAIPAVERIRIAVDVRIVRPGSDPVAVLLPLRMPKELLQAWRHCSAVRPKVIRVVQFHNVQERREVSLSLGYHPPELVVI